MTKLILIRHGQSIWNAENRFTGWTDIELSEKGVKEAEDAGSELKDLKIDVIHTSDLIRAKRTAEIVLLANSASVNVETKLFFLRFIHTYLFRIYMYVHCVKIL